ncbi:MAG: hypothetical protein IGS50_23405 [Synechococcales cyanobacterium C42_A2020_086]|nr:hypothetical protein [Synechococcales cyanobacterium C42_A2020_086]
MGNLCLLAASLVAQGQAPGWSLEVPTTPFAPPPVRRASIARLCGVTPQRAAAFAVSEVHPPEFSSRSAMPIVARATTPRPRSGSQLYAQRWAALKAGQIYTRLAVNSFQAVWQQATRQPTYEEWVALLKQEAQSLAYGQGTNRLTVLVGDSHALWFPSEQLTQDRLWLNQGISGDTTAGVLKRISAFRPTRPDSIHVMVGINDLRKGATDGEVLANLRQIMRQLRQDHPSARVYIHSILPTRSIGIPAQRIRWLNHHIATVTRQEGVHFIDLQPAFADADGNLRASLTTDGLHLNARGYQTWQAAVWPIF